MTKLDKAVARLEAWRSEPRHTMGQMVLTDPNQIRADLRTVLDALAKQPAKPVVKWRGDKASAVVPVRVNLRVGPGVNTADWYAQAIICAVDDAHLGFYTSRNEARAAAEAALARMVAE